ncbi:MAG: Rieske 2Fe-2S domain-containing protein [Cytophagales bacterium]
MEKHLLFEKKNEMFQLPDRKVVNAKLNERLFCLSRIGEEVFAFERNCPHLSVPLSQSGVLNTYGDLVCKEHGHSYSLKTGECKNNPYETLKMYRVSVEKDRVYVEL